MDTHFEELISAYFDGEVTAEQRQQVERLLAENGEARELLDELSALRADMQSLPRHRLETDFADRVLQRIGETADAPPTGETNPVPPVPAERRRAAESDRASDSGMRRALLWSSLAVAAAVLIMIYSGNPPDATVAMKEEEETSTVSAAPTAREAGDRAAAQDEAMVADHLEIGADVSGRLEGRDSKDLFAKELDKQPRDKLYRDDAKAGQIAMRAGPEEKPTDSLASAADFDANRPTRRPLTKAGEESLSEEESTTPGRAGIRLADHGRHATPATSEAAAALAPKSAAPAPAGILSDNDGIAYFRSTGQASPAVVDAYVRGQLGANELRANHARQQGLELHRQVRRALPTDAKRRAIEKKSEYVDIVYEIEGTSEQILATLVGLKTQSAAVQFVSADARLGKMLASLPSRTENDAEKGLVDQLAQANPQATGKLKSRYVEEAAADDDVSESFADKEAKQDLSDAPAEPAANGSPQKAARGFAQLQRAAPAANAPDVAKNIKPAAEASESRAGSGVGGEAGRVAQELQKKAQQGQAAKDAAMAQSERRRREADRVDGVAESSRPAPAPAAADIESRRKAATLPAGEKAEAADKGGAARDQQPGQLAEREKSSETRYRILLVFRLDNAAWLGNGDNPAAARQAIGDELPAATEAGK